MASVVGICNAALTAIGASTIMALDEDTEPARVCRARYEDCRDEVLVVHPWNGATIKAELARLSSTPLFGYAYAYQLPSKPYCLRVLKLSEEDSGYTWQVTGRTLETDSETANIEYIKQVSDPNEMSPGLRSVIAARLAAEIVYKLTANATLRTTMWDIYTGKLAEAKAKNAQEIREDPDTEDVKDPWLKARA